MINRIRFIFIPLLSLFILAGCGGEPNEETASSNQSEMAVTQADTARGCNAVVTAEPYDIPAQRFDATAQQLAHASGCFIETDLAETGDIQVKAIKGKISIHDAVAMAIEGTDLELEEATSEKLVVTLADSDVR